MKSRLWWIVVLVTMVMMVGCQPNEGTTIRSVYYWRHDVTFSDGERSYLRDHQISSIYLHLFDIVRDRGELQPSVTTRFRDSIPSGIEVIPVVFLNHDIMRDTAGLEALPERLTRRVVQMMEKNGQPRPRELQVDFDWTRSNEVRYFAFLQSLRAHLQREGIGRLSATIRLHQLAMAAPPVDYGALMVYNIGNYADVTERCSILTPHNLEPYLRYLKDYPLSLSTALPIYQWDLLFHRGTHFECIVRGVDTRDTVRFEQIDDTHFCSVSYQAIPTDGISMRGEGRILPGDVIRHEWVPAAVLDSVRSMLESSSPSVCHQIILYHLDDKQINQYSYEEIQKIYTGR